MSKLVAIIYSFLILIQSFNINIEDISKLNTLLEHAKFHQKTYGDTFIEFLSEHYGEQMVSHQENHKEHKDLPFKDHKHMLCHVNTAFILTPYTANLIVYKLHKEIPLNFFYKESFSKFEKHSVFQPPKSA
ncbi:hypothetical protein MBM09_03100 [Flaviramulus sp. BrNp1-15]|uniref:hypothetical protein n=1 Tax=Flaviramulus sp. BrNp1-15 TaxID=2916754 RepID=UPI001EE89E34|nr:hypothetical protein [Flaviramulus sp. BrNp1-15]ULC59978.1 hypothetical protein MBM09_03100 [Flaviramulus sp. BrNp1-15]